MWNVYSIIKSVRILKKLKFFLTFDILKHCVKSKNREGKKKFQLAGALNDVNQPYLCVADLQKRMKIQMENFFVPQQTTSLQDGPKGLFCSLWYILLVLVKHVLCFSERFCRFLIILYHHQSLKKSTNVCTSEQRFCMQSHIQWGMMKLESRGDPWERVQLDSRAPQNLVRIDLNLQS